MRLPSGRRSTSGEHWRYASSRRPDDGSLLIVIGEARDILGDLADRRGQTGSGGRLGGAMVRPPGDRGVAAPTRRSIPTSSALTAGGLENAGAIDPDRPTIPADLAAAL